MKVEKYVLRKRMFSQTVLTVDPGLDTVTSSFLMTPSGSADSKGN